MRETTRPKQKKFSEVSLPWIVRFLNLRDDKEREEFLAESLLLQDDKGMAGVIQQNMIALIDAALREESPEGLVWELNAYIAKNSESDDPRRRYPTVRPHWVARRLKDVRVLDTRQASLRIGRSRWVVEPWHLMPGLQGQVWLCVVQCLETGDFGRLRRCFLGTCRRFFITDDARRRFCSSNHQKAYDAEAAKMRVKASRERQRKGLRAPKRKPRDIPEGPITDTQRFADFLNLARGHVIPGGELALFIKRKIPGEWRAVKAWLAQDQPPPVIWASLPAPTKQTFRRELWGTVGG